MLLDKISTAFATAQYLWQIAALPHQILGAATVSQSHSQASL
jgi:hypothetical protein